MICIYIYVICTYIYIYIHINSILKNSFHPVAVDLKVVLVESAHGDPTVAWTAEDRRAVTPLGLGTAETWTNLYLQSHPEKDEKKKSRKKKWVMSQMSVVPITVTFPTVDVPDIARFRNRGPSAPAHGWVQVVSQASRLF